MQTLAIANHKGGVAKTATAHNLGAVLALEHGRRVLLVDTDPQASLTGACGVQEEMAPAHLPGQVRYLKQIYSLAEVLGGARPGQVALRDVLIDLGERLWLCPADTALAASAEGLATRLGRELVLKKVLATVADDFDVCIIDCPPDQGLLTINALCAADAVIIPSQLTAQDLRGLYLFVEVVRTVQAEINPGLALLGVLPTFYDDRLKLHRQGHAELSANSLPSLPVTIGRSVRVAEASGAGQPLVTYRPQHPQAQNYRRLAEIVRDRLAASQ
jgi:chromosome partitioning protein